MKRTESCHHTQSPPPTPHQIEFIQSLTNFLYVCLECTVQLYTFELQQSTFHYTLSLISIRHLTHI